MSLGAHLPDDRDPDCAFCAKLDSGGDVDVIGLRPTASFEPLNPVTPGHRLFIPTWHETWDTPTSAGITAAARSAAEYGKTRGVPFNLITSCGADATQTIPHIHVHYVPRADGDGLPLPWTPQKSPSWAAAREALARADEGDQEAPATPDWWDMLRGIVNG